MNRTRIGIFACLLLLAADLEVAFAQQLGRVISLQSVNYRNRYVRHRNTLGELTPVRSPLDRKDASFRIVRGLAGRGSVSFESVNYPGHFLRHQGYRIKLHRRSNSDLYRKDASFRVRSGLAGRGKSFESVNYPGHYLRHCGFHLWIDNNRRNRACNPRVWRADVSFVIVAGLSGSPAPPPPKPVRVETGHVVSLRSINYPKRFVRHRNALGELTPVRSPLDRKDASFRMVRGLAGRGSVSFESVNFPGHFLRHQGYRIKLHRRGTSALYRKDASFHVRAGLAGRGRSFESVNYPGHYLRHCGFHLWIDNNRRNRACNPRVWRADVSFMIGSGFATASSSPPVGPRVGRTASLRSVNFPNRYVRHRNALGELTPVRSPLDRKDASFRMVPGLAGRGSISFESVNFPGYFLRHQGYRIKLHRRGNSALYRKAASFRVRPGLAGRGKSFESVNYPGHYLRHCGFHLWIDNNRRNRACNPRVWRPDVSFIVIPAFAR